MNLRFRVPGVGFYLCVIPSAALALRLVWEQTVLSWERGPQMVGFSLMHSGFGLLLFAVLAVAVVWAITVFLMNLFGKGEINGTHLLGALVVLAAAGAVTVPYGKWVQLFSNRIAQGPHASEFLVHMAAIGDKRAVEALLQQGVPINTSNRSGIRAVEAAENTKQAEMREFLVSRGATYKRF